MFFCFIFIALSDPTWQEAWRIPLAENLEIYQLDAYAQNNLAVSSQGIVLIKNVADLALVFLKPDGTLSQRSGRQGQGPQEFLELTAVTWDASQNAFVVLDRMAKRLSFYAESGQFKSSQPTDSLSPASGFGSADTILFIERNRETWEHTLTAYAWASGTKKPLLTRKFPMIATAMEWNPRYRFDGQKDWIAVNYGAEPMIHIFSGTGVPLHQITFEIERVPFSDTYYDKRLKVMSQADKAGDPVSALARLKKYTTKEEYWPYLQAVYLDNNQIWLFTYPIEGRDTCFFQALTAQGDLHIKGQLKGHSQALTQNTLFMVEATQDEPILVKYTLQ
ncbi:MAG: hypothetical protein H6510_14760 [Acidobacteria bacterium]|nr:hypothetical protein [Acidobacteriota bacterium]